jgi:hypothetical protein
MLQKSTHSARFDRISMGYSFEIITPYCLSAPCAVAKWLHFCEFAKVFDCFKIDHLFSAETHELQKCTHKKTCRIYRQRLQIAEMV